MTGRQREIQKKKRMKDKIFSAKSERSPNPIKNNWPLESTTETSERRLDLLQRSDIFRLLCIVWKAKYRVHTKEWCRFKS